MCVGRAGSRLYSHEHSPTLAHADWFEAGKGQDPNVTRLDGDMDDYWNQKAAAEDQDGATA